MAFKSLTGFDASNQNILNVADPTANTHAVNKQYVDAFVRGLSWKDSVIAASTANVSVSSAPSSLDGVTLTSGDRVLLKDQTAGAENGIYVFTAAASALTRALDADTADELIGATVTATKGTVNADRVYRLVTDDVTLDTTSLSWTELGGGGTTYTAGSGLTESPAGTFNVANTDGALSIGANSVDLAAQVAGAGLTLTSGVLDVVGDASITVSANQLGLASGVAGAGLTLNTGVLAIGAGSGITVNADDIQVDTSVVVTTPSTVVRKFSTSIGNGSLTSIAVTHNLGTKDITWSLRANSDDSFVVTDGVATDTNTLTLTFATAPTSNQYRVVVHG